MTNANTKIALPSTETKKPAAQPALSEAVAVEVIHGNFASDADREEFVQTVRMHGVTFLYLANSPLPQPSSHDLSMIEGLARLLSRFWPQALVIGGCHD